VTKVKGLATCTQPPLGDAPWSGELALWLDGKLVAHFRKGSPRDRWTGMGFRLLAKGGEPFEGFNWRTSDALLINNFWLEHYVTENAARQNKVASPRHKTGCGSTTWWSPNATSAPSRGDRGACMPLRGSSAKGSPSLTSILGQRRATLLSRAQ
jgi:hypothetical protein